jgi:soluble lytic murein transglycosylase-like protein
MALGALDPALRVLDRWAQGDARLAAHDSIAPGGFVGSPNDADSSAAARDSILGTRASRPWNQLLAAASLAYGAGRWATGIRYARAAFDAVPDSQAMLRWGIAPWIVPPALADDWVAEVAPPESDDPLGAEERQRLAPTRPDLALLYGVTWQESKFDPRARSRSDARGLMQLKLPTAVEQARLLHMKRPTAADLFDPKLNLELGAAYLGRLLARFQGRATLALAAYNAGPTAAQRWARMPDPGGEMMACELIGYGQAHDYVQIILGLRQAVKELKPRRE